MAEILKLRGAAEKLEGLAKILLRTWRNDPDLVTVMVRRCHQVAQRHLEDLRHLERVTLQVERRLDKRDDGEEQHDEPEQGAEGDRQVAAVELEPLGAEVRQPVSVAPRGGGKVAERYLPLNATLEAERSDANRLVPIFMAHGQFDDIIPITRATGSRDSLHKLGYDVEWHDYPMPHSVVMEEIADINRWLLKVLG